MFSSSQLTDEQKAKLREWAADGASIADLQAGLREEYGLKITYMDARLIVLDLEIEIQDDEKKSKATPTVGQDQEAGGPAPVDASGNETSSADATQGAGGGGAVSVSVDQVAMPGAVVSGKVTFSDGEKAVWMLDQYGRPGLDPDTPGYRPGKEDVEAFQKQLSEVLRKQGY